MALSSYLWFFCKLLLTCTNVFSFSNESTEINKIINSFSSSYSYKFIQLITDATNKTILKKETNLDILRDCFYMIILMSHCELHIINAVSSRCSSCNIFWIWEKAHNKTSACKFYARVSCRLCSYKAKE